MTSTAITVALRSNRTPAKSPRSLENIAPLLPRRTNERMLRNVRVGYVPIYMRKLFMQSECFRRRSSSRRRHRHHRQRLKVIATMVH